MPKTKNEETDAAAEVPLAGGDLAAPGTDQTAEAVITEEPVPTVAVADTRCMVINGVGVGTIDDGPRVVEEFQVYGDTPAEIAQRAGDKAQQHGLKVVRVWITEDGRIIADALKARGFTVIEL